MHHISLHFSALKSVQSVPLRQFYLLLTAVSDDCDGSTSLSVRRSQLLLEGGRDREWEGRTGSFCEKK